MTVPKANYIAVRGKGNPNEEGGAYQQAISVLYAVAYTLRMSYKTDYKIDGFFEYVVPPLEGFWWQENIHGVNYADKDSFNWISVIRLPVFVSQKDFEWAVESATKKKKIDCSSAEFLTIEEGLCVQIMHLGAFDDEPATVAIMDEYQIFTNEDVERLVNLYLDGADRDKLDQTLDACTAIYKQLDTDDQIKFKSAAKSFVRTYGFLGAILPYGNADWERLSIFLNLLIPKLPSPREDDLSQGILETIDLESYRNEAREVMSIKLEDSDTEVDPVPAGKVGHIVEPEMDLLSVILSNFNDMFGNISWNDADNVRRQILEIPAMVSRDEKYQKAMKNSDEQSARLESERALQQVIFAIMADNMELFKQFQDNPSFKKWLSDLVFNLTYNKDGKPYEPPQQEHNQGNQDTAQQP